MFFIKKNFYKIIPIPFLISIASFILYFRYLLIIKTNNKIRINDVILVSLYRYRNIAVFSLAIGVFLLLIKTIINYKNNDKEYNKYNEDKKVLNKVSVNNTIENSNVIDDYTSVSDSKIVNELLNDKTLKLNFINTEENTKKVKFYNYNADKKIIEFYDLSAKTLESRKQLKNSFHKIKKIINILLALLIIVLILLISVQINKKSNINKQNLNIKKTTELFK